MSLLKKAISPSDAAVASPPLPPASKPAEEMRDLWAVIESDRFPGEDVLVVLDPTQLDQARAAHPGLVTYLASEINLLWPVRDKDEMIRSVHKIKKHLGGWVREVKPPEIAPKEMTHADQENKRAA